MIRNDEELKVVSEQLGRAQSALASLRRDVLPKNENLYHVMAESCIDTIVELRGHIDAYLDISIIPQSADIVISLEGDRVGLGKTSAAAVTRFIDTFRRGLQSVIEILESIQRPETSRRRPRWVESICDLPLVGTGPGSLKIMLGEPTGINLFNAEERDAFLKGLNLIFAGLEWADVEGLEPSGDSFYDFDPNTKQAILGLLTRLLPPRSGDIERVGFLVRTTDGSQGFRKAMLTRKSRERIRREMEAISTHTEFVELEGTIRSVDLDAQAFLLRERPDNQADLPCEYGSELEDAVKESLDCRVVVAGSLETSHKTGKSKLLADSIELFATESEMVE
jgi:hypothetical protein